MKNTIQNIEKFQSSLDPQVSAKPFYRDNQGKYVFWMVNLKELFNININYPGINRALNKAFMGAKKYVPYDTGITQRSMTMRVINDYMVEVYFDPKKIIGKVRKGIKVKENYTIYIASSAKRFNWISICMYHFYTILFKEVKELMKKQKIKAKNDTVSQKIDTKLGLAFMEILNMKYKADKKEAKRLRDEQDEERKLKEEELRERRRLKRIKQQAREEMEKEG